MSAETQQPPARAPLGAEEYVRQHEIPSRMDRVLRDLVSARPYEPMRWLAARFAAEAAVTETAVPRSEGHTDVLMWMLSLLADRAMMARAQAPHSDDGLSLDQQKLALVRKAEAALAEVGSQLAPARKLRITAPDETEKDRVRLQLDAMRRRQRALEEELRASKEKLRMLQSRPPPLRPAEPRSGSSSVNSAVSQLLQTKDIATPIEMITTQLAQTATVGSSPPHSPVVSPGVLRALEALRREVIKNKQQMSPRLRAAGSAIAKSQAAMPEAVKYADDGQAMKARSADEPRAVEPVSFFERGYVPPDGPTAVMEVTVGLGRWLSPQGLLWPKDAIGGLQGNCRMIVSQHSHGRQEHIVVPLYVYSVSLYRPVTWAGWVGPSVRHGCYSALPPLSDAFAHLEKVHQLGHLTLTDGVRAEMDEHFREVWETTTAAQSAEHEEDEGDQPPDDDGDSNSRSAPQVPRSLPTVGSDGEATWYGGSDCGTTVLRFENKHADPITDSVAWLFPAPLCLDAAPYELGPFSLRRSTNFKDARPPVEGAKPPGSVLNRPPCGVLEYVYSRRTDESLQTESWRCESAMDDRAKRLQQRCYSKKNQRDHYEDLEEKLAKLFVEEDVVSGLSVPGRGRRVPLPLLRALLDTKRSQDRDKTALSIANGLDIQRVVGGPDGDHQREYLIALSGHPFAIADVTEWCDLGSSGLSESACTHRVVTRLHRVVKAFRDQPYAYLNRTMRNLQMGRIPACVEVRRGAGRSKQGKYKSMDGVRGHVVCFYREQQQPRLPTAYTLATDGSSTTLPSMHSGHSPATSNTLRRPGRPSVGAMEQVFWSPGENEEGRWAPSGTWRCRGPGGTEEIAAEHVDLDVGAWMFDQVKPLLWHIQRALATLPGPPSGVMKTYRGLAKVVLSRDIYDKGRIVVWSAFSSSSRDQGVATAFAGAGGHASVFTLMGSTCKSIALWSRFAREEEYLFQANTKFHVTFLLSQEAQDILKTGLQLYEMREVSDTEVHRLNIRGLLPEAKTTAAASIIFVVEKELTGSGGGIVELSLADERVGHLEEQWVCTVHVAYDARSMCPAKTVVDMEAVKSRSGAEHLWRELLRLHAHVAELVAAMCIAVISSPQGLFDDDDDIFGDGGDESILALGSSPHVGFGATHTSSPTNRGVVRSAFRRTDHRILQQAYHVDDGSEDGFVGGQRGRAVVRSALDLLGITARQPVVVTLREIARSSGPALDADITCRRERWDVLAELRKSAARPGMAIGDEGAELLARVLELRVPLRRISLCNNGISEDGAAKLLEALRQNPHVEQLTLAEPTRDTEEFKTCARAVKLRCLHNRSVTSGSGVVSAEDLKLLGHGIRGGWPRVASLALWDVRDMKLDFEGTFTAQPDGALETEQFILQLQETRVRNQCAQLPAPDGALLPATRCASPKLVQTLLDYGANYCARDKFGEPAWLKLERRAGTAKWLESEEGESVGELSHSLREQINLLRELEKDESPKWADVIDHMASDRGYGISTNFLDYCTSAPLCEPPEPAEDHAQWYLKSFALQMYRAWHIKDGDVIDELISNLTFPTDAATSAYGTTCQFQTLRRCAEELRKQYGINLPGKRQMWLRTPSLVWLLIFGIYTMHGADIDRALGFRDAPRRPRESELKLTGDEDQIWMNENEEYKRYYEQEKWRNARGMPARDAWREAGKLVCFQDDQGEGIAMAWESMQRWVKFYGVLNSLLLDPIVYPESNQERRLHRTASMTPLEIAQHRALHKGQKLVWPVPEFADLTDKCNRQLGSVHDKLHFIIHSQETGGALEAVSEYPQRGDILLPAMTLFTVDEIWVDREGCLTIDLISSGSILATDPELQQWQRACCAEAETALERLLCEQCPHRGPTPCRGPQSDAMSAWSCDAHAEESRQFVGQRWLKKVQLGRSRIEEAQQAARTAIIAGAESRVLEEAGTELYAPAPAAYRTTESMTDTRFQDFRRRRECAQATWGMLQRIRRYSFPAATWNNGRLRADTVFPYTMRLGFTFLQLLGRDGDRRQLIPGVPRVSFSGEHTIWDRADDEVLEISAMTVDEQAQRWDAVVSQHRFGPGRSRTSDAVEFLSESMQLPRRPEDFDVGMEVVHDRKGKGTVVRTDTHRRRVRVQFKDGRLRDFTSGETSVGDLQPLSARMDSATDAWYQFAKSPMLPLGGPPAPLIYGDKAFRITIGELKELRASVCTVTTQEVPGRFYEELTKKFLENKDHMLFFNVRRGLPLSAVDDESEWQSLKLLEEDLLDIAEEEFNAAERNVLEAAGQADTPRLHRALYEAWWRLKVRRRVHEHLRSNEKERSDSRRTAVGFRAWRMRVLEDARGYGFSDVRSAQLALGKSITELSTCVCHSMKGYILADGPEDAPNLIAHKTPQPIAFLSAPGVDFSSPVATAREAPKYFARPQCARGTAPYKGWKGFLPGKEDQLRHRVTDLYRAVFEAAQLQGVRNPSMMPIGLGVFCTNVDQGDRARVKQVYFAAQFDLLKEKDWGFENYFLNPGEGNIELARELLEKSLAGGGGPAVRKKSASYARRGEALKCSVVLHDRDCKVLAVALARERRSPGLLNPSDAQAVMQGALGLYWELGRCGQFAAAEDFVATSTASLALLPYPVAGATELGSDRDD